MPFRKGISNKQSFSANKQSFSANKYQFQISTDFKSFFGNCKLEIANWKFKGGFTLIEFIVVLGILGFVVTSTVLFLNSVLRGANQTNITQEVKQNGQAVLDSLDKQIRGAVGVVGVEGGPVDYTAIVLTRPNDDPLYIKCFTDGASGVKNNRIATAVSATGTPSYVSISNDNTVIGVNITGCKFNIVSASVSQGATVPAVVAVSFTANQGLDAPYRQDYAASAPFQTTISLRTY